jgi:hypothetical protein
VQFYRTAAFAQRHPLPVGVVVPGHGVGGPGPLEIIPDVGRGGFSLIRLLKSRVDAGNNGNGN